MNIKLTIVNNIGTSFEKSDVFEFEGDLIFLTGKNGSGKSQLLHGCVAKYNNIGQQIININIDGIDRLEILYKSFKDSIISFSGLGHNDPNLLYTIASGIKNNSSRNQQNGGGTFFNALNAIKLDLESKGKSIDHSSIESIRESLLGIGNLGEIWQSDDIFNTNNIGDLFLSYIRRKNNYIINNRTKNPVISEQEFYKENPKPRDIINELFTILGFDYRFASEYDESAGTLSENLRLYNKDYEKLGYSIESLSDGEKVIFGIALAGLRIQGEGFKYKTILLDEIDATLNPSLTKPLLEIVKRFFVDKGIKVLFATHSTSTLSLALDHNFGDKNVSFYELRKKGVHPRYIQIDPRDYEEMRLAHASFYNKIDQQELELEKITQQLKSISYPLLITEGKTDIKHINKAREKLEIEINYDQIGELQQPDGCINLDKLLNSLAKIGMQKMVIGIFDTDVPYIYESRNGDHQSCKYHKYGDNIYGICIPIPHFRSSKDQDKISIEYLYNDLEIRKRLPNGLSLFLGTDFSKIGGRGIIDKTMILQNQTDRGIDKIIENNGGQAVYNTEDINLLAKKNDFADAIVNGDINISIESWESFRPLFVKIQYIIDNLP